MRVIVRHSLDNYDVKISQIIVLLYSYLSGVFCLVCIARHFDHLGKQSIAWINQAQDKQNH